MNLATALEQTASDLPDKVAFHTPDQKITFAEFDDLVGRTAGGLADLGVRPGDRVAVMAGSHPEFVAAIHAAWRLGAVFVSLNAQLGPEEVLYQIENSGARVVIADPGKSRGVIDSIAERVPRLKHVVGTGEAMGDFRSAIDLADDAYATIFYTSGTTGVPKGATHTHRALFVQCDEVTKHYRITEDEVFLSVLPIYLLSILILGPIVSLYVGSTCRLLPQYEAGSFARTIKEDQTTMIGASIPMMFADLLDLPPAEAAEVDLSSVRVASCGGAPMPPEVRKTFEERFDFRFIHAYGGTEGPAIVSTDPVDKPRKFDSVGAPMAHIKVTIENEDGEDLPAGEIGEICTSAHDDGPYAGLYEPVRAYWGMPEATTKALRGGRFHWGDIGYLDEDGFLFLVDRKNDMIIRGGMNVYPKELESLLYEDERIVECAVVGATHNRYGEVAYAFIRLAPGTEMSESEALDLTNDRLAKFKHLAGVTFVENYPRNTLGKILKRELRKGLSV